MVEILENSFKINFSWPQKLILTSLFIFVQNINQIISTSENDMLSAELDIIPLLSEICTQSESSNPVHDHRSMEFRPIENPTSTNIKTKGFLDPRSQPLNHPDLNQTLAEASHVLLDELLMCIDQFSGSTTHNRNITNNSILKNRSTPVSSNAISYTDDKTKLDAYFNQAHSMGFDPQLVTMLKDFDLLSEAVNNGSKALHNDLNMDYEVAASFLNDTFINSAITLYETFITNYNMTAMNIQIRDEHSNKSLNHPSLTQRPLNDKNNEHVNSQINIFSATQNRYFSIH